MQFTLLVKIRLFVVLAVSLLLFTTLGWFFARPMAPEGALMIVGHHQPAVVMLFLVLLAVIVTAVGLIIGRRHAGQIAPMALPLGLICWVIQSGGIETLLIKCTDVAALETLSRSMIIDTILWCIPVGLTFGVVVYGGRYLASLAGPQVDSDDKPSRHDVTATTESLLAAEGVLAKQWLRNIAALAVTCVVAIILLKIFLQTGKSGLVVNQHHILGAVPASLGQIIFSLLAAFGVGAWAGHQLLGAPLWCFVAAPPLVGLFNMITGMTSANLETMANMTSIFFPAQMTTAMVLPLQYIAVGTLAVMWGHWFSLLVHHEKKMQAEAVENEDSDQE